MTLLIKKKKKVVYHLSKIFLKTRLNGLGVAGLLKLLYSKELSGHGLALNPFLSESGSVNTRYDISDYTAVSPYLSHGRFYRWSRSASSMVLTYAGHGFNHCSTEYEVPKGAGWGYHQISSCGTSQRISFVRLAAVPGRHSGIRAILSVSLWCDSSWSLTGATPMFVNRWICEIKGVKGFRFDVINVIGKDEVPMSRKQDGSQPIR